MRALRGLIISENQELRERVQELLDQSGLVEPALVLSRYPQQAESAGHIRLARPDVAFLVIDRIPVALDFIRELDAACPGAMTIAISHLDDPRALTELMRAGVRDFVAAPINPAKFDDAVRRVLSEHVNKPYEPSQEPLITFWPSRGGSGTSTLACNVSRSLAGRGNLRVLLADLDICAGLSRYVFEIAPTCSLMELAELGQGLDPDTWTRCVTETDSLHVLYGGKQEIRTRFAPHYMRDLVRYAAQRYSAILVDLPVTLESYALELLRRSRRILLVTTCEVPSLGVTREKLEYLSDMDLHSRTGILLTLGPFGAAPNLAHLQAYLGAPIDAVFDFSEKKVRQCLSSGTAIDERTVLGRQVNEFATELATLF